MKFYFKKLEQNPYLHDKVEFYILFSCYDFTFNDRKKELEEFGFDKNEIEELKEKLVEFTNELIEDFPTIKEYYIRSEEHTSELQSRRNIVCRLLLEKKKKKKKK